MSTILQPLSNGLYTVGKGVLTFFPFANENDPESISNGFRIGDCDSVSVEVEVTESERFSNEYSVKTLVLSAVDEVSATISITAAQMSELVRAASLLGKQGSFSQDAETGVTKALPKAGIYLLGGLGVKNLTVTKDGSPAVAGTDYLVDAPSGQIETLADDMSVTYDIPEISGQFATGVASGNGIRGRLVFRGVNSQGVKSLLTLWDVSLKPSGAREFLSESDVSTIDLEGTCAPVGGRPDGFAIGFETTLE